MGKPNPHDKSEKKRDYREEYIKYHSSNRAKKVRAKNNKANRDAGTYGNHDRLDVAHAEPQAKGSTKLQSESKNRSFKRNSKAQRA